MSKKYFFSLLMIASGLLANAQPQRLTCDISQVFDGMDSITLHYNPYGSGGDAGDVAFQATSGPLYAYCYLTDSIPGSGGHIGAYNNGSWLGVVTTIDSFVKVSDSDWVWVMPNVRQFFSVPNDVYVSGVNIIVHDTTGSTQSQNLYLPVSESFSSTTGLAVTTGPLSSPPATLVADSTENLAVYYHPQLDTFRYSPAASNGDSIFKNYNGTIYVYSWAVYNGNAYQLTPWGSVGSTPTDSLVKIDSNDYVWDIHNLRDDFINAGFPSGDNIDTLAVIFRTASGDTQTVNMYIPLVITATPPPAPSPTIAITYYPPVVFDGMDSIFVHYNPYAFGGLHADTIFQTYTGPLYAYAYLTDSISGSGGHIGVYNNGSWTGVDIPVDSLRKVSDSDYVWVIPNLRQFFSVPSGVYVTGVNIIFHNTSGDTQSNNAYFPVTHAFGTAGEAVTTGPLSSWPGGPFLADSNENVAVYYHPQYDTFTNLGDTVFKNYGSTIYVYSYAIYDGSTYQLTPWASVGATPTDSLVKIDNNNYVWDLPNLRADFIAAGLPSGTDIDTLTVIFRTALGDTQTANIYIPLVIDTASTTGIVNINNTSAKVVIYPNPASEGMLVSYSFKEIANTAVSIANRWARQF